MSNDGYVKFESPSDRELFEQIRKACLSLPETTERLSHGAPTFFIKEKKSFVTYHNNHHGDGRIAIWCASSSEVQSMLVTSWPDIYFVPPYVGHLGWVGLRLDRNAEWKEIVGVIGDAYLTRAPKKLKENMDISDYLQKNN